MKRIWAQLKKTRTWIDERCCSEGHDLSLADEIFAIFCGVTLFISMDTWVSETPRIIFSIVAAVSVTVVAMMVAINQTQCSKRLLAYVAALVMSFVGIDWILEVSSHDLITEQIRLDALPEGLAAWIVIREAAVFILNRLGRTTSA